MHLDRVQQGRRNRELVLELLSRFVEMSSDQVAAVLFGGRLRAANRVLLSLVEAKRLHRFTTQRQGPYIYSLRRGPTGQTDHNLLISGLYVAMRRQAPALYGAGNVVLIEGKGGLITDLLAVHGDLAVCVEVHRATHQFGTKLDRYEQFRQELRTRARPLPPWMQAGMKVVYWLIGPPASVGWLERTAQPYREAGANLVVSAIPEALADPWKALGETPIRWKALTKEIASQERCGTCQGAHQKSGAW